MPNFFASPAALRGTAIGLPMILAGCAAPSDTNANLYGSPVQHVYAVLAGTQPPRAVMDELGLPAGLTQSSDNEPGKSVTWHFDVQGYHMLDAQVLLAPEGAAATRVTVNVRFTLDSALAKRPHSDTGEAPGAALPATTEAARQAMVEFVDATLTARGYDTAKVRAFRGQYAVDLQAEGKKLSLMLAHLAAPLPGPAAPVRQPGVAHITTTPGFQTTDMTAPMITPAPTSNGEPTEVAGATAAPAIKPLASPPTPAPLAASPSSAPHIRPEYRN
jgi:hypothetical protein